MARGMDLFFLRQALELAQKRRGFCAPNPSVGAVLVRNGRVIAEGFHWAAGKAHAEVEALNGVPDEIAQSSTLYISLEPCCHVGKTPPCTDLILQRGIPKVVFAYEDPNPRVAGQGRATLERAGVEVRHVPLAEVDAFYASYRHWTQTRMPFTTVKLAMSLDGKTAAPGGLPIALTGSEANRLTHQCRLQSDAILTTARTILADDPRLNSRLGESEVAKPIVILDRLGRTPVSARLFRSARSVTVFVGDEASLEKIRELRALNAHVVSVPTPQGLLPLDGILRHLGESGIHDLWVEGGPAVFTAFLREKLAQKAFLYIAPVTVGEGISAFSPGWESLLEGARVTWSPQGRDVVAEVVW